MGIITDQLSRCAPTRPGAVAAAGPPGRAGWLRQELLLRGILPVIPPNPVRKEPVSLDHELHRLRNHVERCVGWLKGCRSVGTRFDKLAVNFLAMVKPACVRLILRRLRPSDRT